MTDEEFALGVDAILLTGFRGHVSHRALDIWWTRYAVERGGALEAATRKWMAAIEGDHDPGNPYPLGRRWWQFWRRRPRSITSSEFEGFQCPNPPLPPLENPHA